MDSFRVIYDTNTLISAYGFDGTPEEAVKIGFYDEIDVYVSHPILEEYRRVLTYDHLPFTREEQETLIDEFCELTNASTHPVPLSIHEVDDDPDDDKFLELAVVTNADYIVTGDKHLLDIGVFRDGPGRKGGTKILQSGAFLAAIDMEPPNSELHAAE